MTAKEQRKAAEDFAAKWLGRGYEKGECQKFWRGLLHDVFGGVRLRPEASEEEIVARLFEMYAELTSGRAE